MNLFVLIQLCLLINLLFLFQFKSAEKTIKPIQFVNGGYESVTIAISQTVSEDPNILLNLREILKQSSKLLWHVTRRKAYFREFNVIIPSDWSDDPSYLEVGDYCLDKADIRIVEPRWSNDEPFTQQLGECGESGQYIFIPTNFITNHENNKHKNFVHEWAHYRYGVFDEHGIQGDPNYPSYVIGEDGIVVSSVCAFVDGAIESPGGICEMNIFNQKIDPECIFIPNEDMKASLMFKKITDEMDGFCNNDEDLEYKHYAEGKTKHNDKCNRRSVLEVIMDHKDFRNQLFDKSKEMKDKS